MKEPDFWSLMREAKSASANLSKMPDYLKDRLAKLPLAEIVDFAACLAMMLDKAHDKRLWAAGSLICGGLGDDGFVYFKCWLIAQGEETFKAAIADPDSLCNVANFDGQYGNGDAQLERLLYVGNEAFKIQTNGIPMSERSTLLPSWLPQEGIHPISTGLKNREFWNGTLKQAVQLFPKLSSRFPLGYKRW